MDNLFFPKRLRVDTFLDSVFGNGENSCVRVYDDLVETIGIGKQGFSIELEVGLL